jgi:acetyl esterase/lipase
MMLVDQDYGSAGSAALRYDAILSDGDPVPAIVCIHGGGWVSGDSSDMHDVARFFAANGYAAFCPQYRLAPLYPYPAAVEDIEMFVGYLRDKANSLRILPGSIGAIGNSAGGHLASMAGLATDGEKRANAVVDVCGLTDLTNMKENHPPISWDFMGQFMAGIPADDPRWIEASPLYKLMTGAPPFLVIHGEQDDVVYVDQSRKFHDALQQAGAEASLHLLPGQGHSFTEPGFKEILDKSLAFFETHLPQRVKGQA